jgi:hypothetical protein
MLENLEVVPLANSLCILKDSGKLRQTCLYLLRWIHAKIMIHNYKKVTIVSLEVHIVIIVQVGPVDLVRIVVRFFICDHIMFVEMIQDSVDYPPDSPGVFAYLFKGRKRLFKGLV